jgi:hypothetical protein
MSIKISMSLVLSIKQIMYLNHVTEIKKKGKAKIASKLN